jgi:hypothetical protein
MRGPCAVVGAAAQDQRGMLVAVLQHRGEGDGLFQARPAHHSPRPTHGA